ncbi:TIGR02391 family protein [Microcoleus sp. MON1_C5]|uniref:TIGR02391 family protein n=1 Tax=Microcoleus sp. MON1_C5 TaxID=2818828 RepID=UPI002FCE8D76
MTPQLLEQLVQKIYELQTLMVTVATGEARIQEKDDEYKQLYMEVNLKLESLQNEGLNVDNPNSFRSLWDWHSFWSDDLRSYGVPHQLVRELYENVLTPFENTLYKHRANSMSSEELIDDLQRRLGQMIPEPQTSFKFTINSLHPKIIQRCQQQFELRQYDDAIFNAMKTVEEEIRARASAAPTDVGVALVSKVMNPNQQPKLIFSSVNAEQEAAHSMYRGAIGSFKNPLSHRFLDTSDPIKTFEILGFASLLMRMLDDATVTPSSSNGV